MEKLDRYTVENSLDQIFEKTSGSLSFTVESWHACKGRRRMVADLVHRHPLIGMTRNEIYELLGALSGPPKELELGPYGYRARSSDPEFDNEGYPLDDRVRAGMCPSIPQGLHFIYSGNRVAGYCITGGGGGSTRSRIVTTNFSTAQQNVTGA